MRARRNNGLKTRSNQEAPEENDGEIGPIGPLEPIFAGVENSIPILAIVGETGSGKSELAQAIARRTNATLISVDSRKVYRGMDIGTAKPSPEDIREFDYGMVDCADPGDYFSAGRFAREARALVAERLKTRRPVILVGGTGFYLDAFINGLADLPEASPALRQRVAMESAARGWDSLYQEACAVDPEFMASVHPGDKTRVRRALEAWWGSGRRLSGLLAELNMEPCPWAVRVVWPEREREQVYNRIAERAYKMRREGLTHEVRGLLNSGIPVDAPGLATVGYRELVNFLDGATDEDAAYELIIQNSRRYAKRQRTWFRHREYVQSIKYYPTVAEDVIDNWLGPA